MAEFRKGDLVVSNGTTPGAAGGVDAGFDFLTRETWPWYSTRHFPAGTVFLVVRYASNPADRRWCSRRRLRRCRHRNMCCVSAEGKLYWIDRDYLKPA
jgi:hypothetical protein